MNDIEWRERGVEWRAWSGTEHAESSGMANVEGVEGEGGVEVVDQDDVEGVDQDDVEGVERDTDWHGRRHTEQSTVACMNAHGGRGLRCMKGTTVEDKRHRASWTKAWNGATWTKVRRQAWRREKTWRAWSERLGLEEWLWRKERRRRT